MTPTDSPSGSSSGELSESENQSSSGEEQHTHPRKPKEKRAHGNSSGQSSPVAHLSDGAETGSKNGRPQSIASGESSSDSADSGNSESPRHMKKKRKKKRKKQSSSDSSGSEESEQDSDSDSQGSKIKSGKCSQDSANKADSELVRSRKHKRREERGTADASSNVRHSKHSKKRRNIDETSPEKMLSDRDSQSKSRRHKRKKKLSGSDASSSDRTSSRGNFKKGKLSAVDKRHSKKHASRDRGRVVDGSPAADTDVGGRVRHGHHQQREGGRHDSSSRNGRTRRNDSSRAQAVEDAHVKARSAREKPSRSPSGQSDSAGDSRDRRKRAGSPSARVKSERDVETRDRRGGDHETESGRRRKDVRSLREEHSREDRKPRERRDRHSRSPPSRVEKPRERSSNGANGERTESRDRRLEDVMRGSPPRHQSRDDRLEDGRRRDGRPEDRRRGSPSQRQPRSGNSTETKSGRSSKQRKQPDAAPSPGRWADDSPGADAGRARVKQEPTSDEERHRNGDGRGRRGGRHPAEGLMSSVTGTGEPQLQQPKSEPGEPVDRQGPEFALSGKLTEDTNTCNGVVVKYSEPPEARKPRRRWRFYVFKGDTDLPTLHIHRQSGFLMGRDRKVADIPIDHPSCSKQHAALQYRLTGFERADGTRGRRVRPYIMDLESANGTFVNNNRIDPRRYVELLERDVVKFGFSSREYVLLHEHSKDDLTDDEAQD